MTAAGKIQFLLTVDTEPDNVWADFRSATLRNVWGLERLHEAARSLGIRPTYLITWSVATGKPRRTTDRLTRGSSRPPPFNAWPATTRAGSRRIPSAGGVHWRWPERWAQERLLAA